MPRAAGPKPTAPSIATPAVSAPYKVLVVDADPDTRFLYKTALEAVTAVISEAEDGAEALGKAICEPPTLVLTDSRLPRLDGFALCASLRREPATAGAGIVVISSVDSPSATSRAYASGADAVLIKPCTMDELVHTVQRVCLTR